MLWLELHRNARSSRASLYSNSPGVGRWVENTRAEELSLWIRCGDLSSSSGKGDPTLEVSGRWIARGTLLLSDEDQAFFADGGGAGKNRIGLAAAVVRELGDENQDLRMAHDQLVEVLARKS